MIDFIKYDLLGVAPHQLEQNTLLEFHYKVNRTTGELGIYQNAYFRGLEFKIYEATTANPEQRITVEGSLHKYWNNGAHNFNDFGLKEIKTALADLERKFSIDPKNCFLRRLEIGINIKPPGKTKDILNQCLMHKTDRMKWIDTKDEGNYIQAQYQRHIIKIYDKKQHYKNQGFQIDEEILRFEIKYEKTIGIQETLKHKGKISIADLLSYGLDKFTPVLLKQWQNVLFYDHSTFQGTNEEFLYSNINYWENLYNNNYEEFKTQRKKMSNLISKNSENLKGEIAKAIKEKCQFLNSQFPEINPLYIRLKKGKTVSDHNGINRRFCEVTGLNISMQKEDSILLSHTGLKYYFKTDRKIFDEVKRKYLSNLWQNSDHKTQIKEIAHNIRNKQYNLKVQQRRIYKSWQPTLFELKTA